MSQTTIVQKPGGEDYDLAARVLELHELELVAAALHQARRLREKALRGNLKRLGREVETHKYQLIRLNQAHPRTLQRLRIKTKDCDALKRWLVELGVDRHVIAARLKAGA
jgi:hypothetical protein